MIAMSQSFSVEHVNRSRGNIELSLGGEHQVWFSATTFDYNGA